MLLLSAAGTAISLPSHEALRGREMERRLAGVFHNDRDKLVWPEARSRTDQLR